MTKRKYEYVYEVLRESTNLTGSDPGKGNINLIGQVVL